MIGPADDAERKQNDVANTFLPGMVGRFSGNSDLTRPHDKFLIHKLELSKKDEVFDKGSAWSGRFLGFIEAHATGAVTFEGIADDGMEVIVEGRKIISAWNQKNTAVAGTVDMGPPARRQRSLDPVLVQPGSHAWPEKPTRLKTCAAS